MEKKIGPKENFESKTNFGFEKMLGKKILWVQKNLVLKNFWAKKNFGPKKCLVKKNYWETPPMCHH